MSKWLVDIHGELEGDYELICKAESVIPLDKVKKAREEIQELIDKCGKDTMEDIKMGIGMDLALTILNNLLESE